MTNPVNLGQNFNLSHHLYPYFMYDRSVGFILCVQGMYVVWASAKTVNGQAGLHFGCLPLQSIPKSNTGHDGCVQALIYECKLVVIFLPISFNIWCDCSKEPSQFYTQKLCLSKPLVV